MKPLSLFAIFALLSACSTPPAPEREVPRPDAAVPEQASAPAASDHPTPSLPFSWPLPPGWRPETIPFPLSFAPSLPYVGLEELRFAPGMFTAGSEEFWTYAFVWWIEGDLEFETNALNAQLASYYEGLSLAVEQRKDFDPKQAVATSTLAPVKSVEAGTTRWNGTVSTYDAFATHARIALNLQAQAFRCETQNRTVALFMVSPQPTDHAIWTRLAALRDSFRCSPP